MTAFNLDVLALLFGAFVLGLALGLWLRRARRPAPKLALEAVERSVPEQSPAPAAGPAPAALAERPAGSPPPAPVSGHAEEPPAAQPSRPAEVVPPSATVAAVFGHLLNVPPGMLEEPEPDEPEPPPRRPVVASVREVHPGTRPPALAEPEGGGADDLKQLKGIGRQNEQRLHELGIFHLRQIAAWTPDEAAWIGSYLAFPGRIEREDWIGQARALTGGARGASDNADGLPKNGPPKDEA